MTTQDKIRTALNETREWYTQKQLMDVLQIVSSKTSMGLAALIGAGEAQRINAPPGFAKVARFIYAAAGVAPPPAEDADGLGKLPPKMKGFRAEARDKKRRAKKRTAKQLSATATSRRPAVKAAPPAHRWALASDGAFVLLGSGVEIAGPQASALAVFIQQLTGSMRAA